MKRFSCQVSQAPILLNIETLLVVCGRSAASQRGSGDCTGHAPRSPACPKPGVSNNNHAYAYTYRSVPCWIIKRIMPLTCSN